MAGPEALSLIGIAGLVSTLALRKKTTSVRAVFVVTALCGAFWRFTGSLPLGLALAVAAERLVLARVSRALLRFRARPTSPLEGLVLEQARAVTRFRNGKGIVAVQRDGREVQLAARLIGPQGPVEVGDLLRIADVDASSERLSVRLY